MAPRLLLLVSVMLHAASGAPIVLDGSTVHHTFDGVGALSAGASSRLLYDYPEPQRSDVLDFLFKPSVGANLQILKVEVRSFHARASTRAGEQLQSLHSRVDGCSYGLCAVASAVMSTARRAQLQTLLTAKR